MKKNKNVVIFSQKFPDAHPSAILKKLEEQIKESPAGAKEPPVPLSELLEKYDAKYTYEPRSNADRVSVVFVFLARELCKDFEIDTEIYRKAHEIEIVMDLYCGWHDSTFKRSFDPLFRLADDFTLSYVKDDPEYVRISMSYYTHDRYSNGEKVEW